MVIWIIGLSGSGKSFYAKEIKKKISNSIIVDGDEVRKYISTDLDYSLQSRNIQINRIYGLAKIAIKSKPNYLAFGAFYSTRTKKIKYK